MHDIRRGDEKMLPNTLTDRELVKFADRYIHTSGLPSDFQREVVLRLGIILDKIEAGEYAEHEDSITDLEYRVSELEDVVYDLERERDDLQDRVDSLEAELAEKQ
jgi:hypothetical protein